MGLRGPCADDEVIGGVADPAQVDDDDIEGLLVLQSVDDQAQAGVFVGGGGEFGGDGIGSYGSSRPRRL